MGAASAAPLFFPPRGYLFTGGDKIYSSYESSIKKLTFLIEERPVAPSFVLRQSAQNTSKIQRASRYKKVDQPF